MFYKNAVRIAAPEYIGVREPHYTAAVGLIRYAFQNLRQAEKEVAASTQSQGKLRLVGESNHQGSKEPSRV